VITRFVQAETQSWVRPQRGSPVVWNVPLAGPNSDIFSGMDTYGWPEEPPPWATFAQRIYAPTAIILYVVPSVIGLSPAAALNAITAANLTGVLGVPILSSIAVGLVAAQSPAAGTIGTLGAFVTYSLSLGTSPTPTSPSFVLEISDNLNGSFNLAWGAPSPPPSSYNVYVNGVLNQNVTQAQALVAGLTIESYNKAAVAPATGNSVRPQNMPPVGVVTTSQTVLIWVTAVYAGVEQVRTPHRRVTVNPSSIALITPMKRPFPFPSTGSPDG
jgi:hypothetical protein